MLNRSLYYKLTANIELEDKAWTPIGTSQFAFKGHLTGYKSETENYAIDGLTNLSYGGTDLELIYHVMNSGAKGFKGYGLFGYVDGATISYLNFTNTKIDNQDKGGFECSAIVVGNIVVGNINGNSNIDTADERTKIEYCTIDSNSYIKGNNKIGGFIGYSAEAPFVLDHCTNNGTIVGYDTKESNAQRVGGLVGAFFVDAAKVTSTISNCINNGAVTAYGGKSGADVWASDIIGADYESCGNNNVLKVLEIINVSCNGTLTSNTNQTARVVGWYVYGNGSGNGSGSRYTNQISISGLKVNNNAIDTLIYENIPNEKGNTTNNNKVWGDNAKTIRISSSTSNAHFIYIENN